MIEQQIYTRSASGGLFLEAAGHDTVGVSPGLSHELVAGQLSGLCGNLSTLRLTAGGLTYLLPAAGPALILGRVSALSGQGRETYFVHNYYLPPASRSWLEVVKEPKSLLHAAFLPPCEHNGAVETLESLAKLPLAEEAADGSAPASLGDLLAETGLTAAEFLSLYRQVLASLAAAADGGWQDIVAVAFPGDQQQQQRQAQALLELTLRCLPYGARRNFGFLYPFSGGNMLNRIALVVADNHCLSAVRSYTELCYDLSGQERQLPADSGGNQRLLSFLARGLEREGELAGYFDFVEGLTGPDSCWQLRAESLEQLLILHRADLLPAADFHGCYGEAILALAGLPSCGHLGQLRGRTIVQSFYTYLERADLSAGLDLRLIQLLQRLADPAAEAEEEAAGTAIEAAIEAEEESGEVALLARQALFFCATLEDERLSQQRMSVFDLLLAGEGLAGPFVAHLNETAPQLLTDYYRRRLEQCTEIRLLPPAAAALAAACPAVGADPAFRQLVTQLAVHLFWQADSDAQIRVWQQDLAAEAYAGQPQAEEWADWLSRSLLEDFLAPIRDLTPDYFYPQVISFCQRSGLLATAADHQSLRCRQFQFLAEALDFFGGKQAKDLRLPCLPEEGLFEAKRYLFLWSRQTPPPETSRRCQLLLFLYGPPNPDQAPSSQVVTAMLGACADFQQRLQLLQWLVERKDYRPLTERKKLFGGTEYSGTQQALRNYEQLVVGVSNYFSQNLPEATGRRAYRQLYDVLDAHKDFRDILLLNLEWIKNLNQR